MPIDPRAHSLLIAGLGGHGKVVADAWWAAHPGAALVGFDDAQRLHGREWFAAVRCEGPVLAARDQLNASKLHLAIGSNRIRERFARDLGLTHLNWAAVIHPRASISPFASASAGSFVAANAVIAPHATVGYGTIVNHSATLDHDAVVGDFCHVAPGAILGGGAQLGARVLLGAGAVVLPGVRICDDAVIGAGAVVVQDILRPGVWRGVPAREH